LKYSYLVFDATNLFWRCFTIALKKSIFELKDKVFICAIEEFFSKIEKFRDHYATKSTKFYFLFDNPNSMIRYRKSLDMNYKSNREYREAPVGFYDTLNRTKEILKIYSDNFYSITVTGAEADDITHPLINKFNSELTDFSRCLCVSADLDWARNISQHVDWFNFKDIFTLFNFKDTYDFVPTAEKIKLYKALHGDTSDNIQNAIPHSPKKFIIEVIEKYQDIQEMFIDLDLRFTQQSCSKWELRILENREIIKKNYKLVDFIHLNTDINQYISKCRQDLYQLKFWSDALGFKLNNYDLNTKNFQNPKEFF
jgi:5'-3' exonuclease